MKKVRTILMGTPEFAQKIFKEASAALKDNLDIVAVITAPDKPVGRRQEMTFSPVKKWALENKFLVLQPVKIKNPKWVEKVKTLNPELIIVCAFSQIIPKEIIDISKYGILNIHPSLLPKHRGPSPIHSTILNNDEYAGVSLMLIDEQMDHGDVIANEKFKIQNSKLKYKELSDRLVDLSIDLLIKTLPDWLEGKVKAKPQEHSKASYCKIIKKQDALIDWNDSAEKIERIIRAYELWPTAYTFWKNKQFKILEVETDKGSKYKIGEVFLNDKGLCVQTGDGVLILKQVQLEGKRPIDYKNFLNGYKDIIGSILTSCAK